MMSQTLTDKDVARLLRGKSVVVHTGQKRIIVIDADSDILRWLGRKLRTREGITPQERQKILEMM